QLANKIETLIGGQFIRSTFTGARATVVTLEITRESDLPNRVYRYKRRAVTRRKITRWASHRINSRLMPTDYFFFLVAPSSCLSADCTSDIHLRALAATFFIS